MIQFLVVSRMHHSAAATCGTHAINVVPCLLLLAVQQVARANAQLQQVNLISERLLFSGEHFKELFACVREHNK